MGPRWLKIEPSRLAMLSALFFSTCVMLFYFIRQCLGVSMGPVEVLLGVAKTFLVSYAGTGFFVWYLLRVAERELPQTSKKPLKRMHIRAEAENVEPQWEEAGLPPEEPEEHS